MIPEEKQSYHVLVNDLQDTIKELQHEIQNVKKQCEWKIGQLNYLERNEDYSILDNETNLKVHYHRKGFIEGLEWYLKTLENTEDDRGK